MSLLGALESKSRPVSLMAVSNGKAPHSIFLQWSKLSIMNPFQVTPIYLSLDTEKCVERMVATSLSLWLLLQEAFLLSFTAGAILPSILF